VTRGIGELVTALAASRRAVQLYPPSHPEFQKAVVDLESAVVETAQGTQFVLNLHQGHLYHGSAVIPDDVNGVDAVVRMFETRSIESLTFQPSFTAADALALTEVLSLKSTAALDIEAELLARSVEAVSVSFLAAPDSVEREERDRLRDADRALHKRILGALRTLSEQVKNGAGPDVSKASGLVGGILERMMDDPSAIMGLATMRGTGERTLFHSLNVMIYTMVLGNRLGLPEEGLSALGTAALLHDVGKSAFDAGDLMQLEAMRTLHPKIGADILQRVALDDPAPMLVAYEHHMHVDGGGFPERPADYIAHPYSRMVAVADRYENLTNVAPGRDALTPDRAIVQILRETGSVLDSFFARLFASAMGVFPVGSLVRLSDQSVAVVIKQAEDPLSPVVRIAYDSRGAEPEEPGDVDLAESDLRIVEVVAPEALNVEVSDKI